MKGLHTADGKAVRIGIHPVLNEVPVHVGMQGRVFGRIDPEWKIRINPDLNRKKIRGQLKKQENKRKLMDIHLLRILRNQSRSQS
jgi:hypothetical protein